MFTTDKQMLRYFIGMLLAVVYSTDIKCMNFYGLETEHKGFVCDWANPPEYYLEKMVTEMGINTIRVPFSYEYLHNNDMYQLDHMIDECERLGLRVILDYHRTWNTHQGPTPEEGISREDFVGAWLWLLDRYRSRETVWGVGVFNEVQLHNDFEYTNALHKDVISSIEEFFPGRFYYFAGCPSWGGNCSAMDLVNTPTWNRTFIEVHKYRFSGNSVPADWDISIPDSISPDHWFVGETGWKQSEDADRQWAGTFLGYLHERKIRNVCAWTIAHSHDTDGWWHDDCTTFDYEKASLLSWLWQTPFARYLRGDRSEPG